MNNDELVPRPDRSVVGGGLFPSAVERQTRREVERVVGAARIAKLTEEALARTIRQLYEEHGPAFAAYLSLEDVNTSLGIPQR